MQFISYLLILILPLWIVISSSFASQSFTNSLAAQKTANENSPQRISNSSVPSDFQFILHLASYLTAEQIRNLATKNEKLETFLGNVARGAPLDFQRTTLSNGEFLTLFGKDGVFSKATNINFTGCRFEHKLLSQLPASIKTLSLAQVGLKADTLKHLAQLTHLENLDLRANKLGEGAGAHLAQLTSLKTLSLAENDLGTDTLETVAKFTHLKTLDLRSNLLNESVKMDLKNNLSRTEILF